MVKIKVGQHYTFRGETYSLGKDGRFLLEKDGNWTKVYVYEDLMKGFINGEVQEKQTMEIGERYYFWVKEGKLDTRLWEGNLVDNALLQAGNVFKSQKDAELLPICGFSVK